MKHFILCLTFLCVGLSTTLAQEDGRNVERDYRVSSPENFALELRVGLYKPDVGNNSFENSFGSDKGPMLAMEFDWLPVTIPYVGRFGAGLGFGWSRYSGNAVAEATGATVSEKTSLTLFPIPVMAVLRIDGLSKELNIPVLFAAKLGVDGVIWNSKTGSRSDGSGFSLGLRWGVQAALELNVFERSAARSLDEEWGINRTFLLFELYGSTAGLNSLPVGAGLAWTAGLGFSF